MSREQRLYERFVMPIEFEPWDGQTVDSTAAYVVLAHAETESVLEETVRTLVEHAATTCENGVSHRVTVNSLMFLGSKLHSAVNVSYVSGRARLQMDASLLLSEWSSLKGREYWTGVLSRNHGTGFNYIENLVHPLGVVQSEKSFGRARAAGVLEIARVPDSLITGLNEFVSLRGKAAHTSRDVFLTAVKGSSPGGVRTSAKRAVDSVASLSRYLAFKLW